MIVFLLFLENEVWYFIMETFRTNGRILFSKKKKQRQQQQQQQNLFNLPRVGYKSRLLTSLMRTGCIVRYIRRR